MNLLEMIKNEMTPGTIGQISNALGENSDKTKSALGSAFPALLGSLVGKATSSPNGAADIFNMIKQGQGQGGWTDSIGKFITGQSGVAPQTAADQTGGVTPQPSGNLLNSMLGSKLGPVTDYIASKTGVSSGSVTSLMGMAAPFLMGTISKVVSSQGLGASGLGQLLTSQIEHLKDAMPAGLADTLGIGNLLKGTQGAPAAAEPYVRAGQPARVGAGGGRWLWVLLLLALIGWLVHHNRNRGEMGGTGQPVGTQVGTAQGPDFSRLNLPPNSIAENTAKTISNGDWNKAIPLQGVNFDSSGAVTDSSKQQFQDVSKVLSAAPNVKVEVTGYGDTEEAGLNRANSIKAALTSAGVSGDRIMAHGQAGKDTSTFRLHQQ